MSRVARPLAASFDSALARRRTATLAAALGSVVFCASAQAHPYVKIADPTASTLSGSRDFSVATHTRPGGRVRRVAFFVDGRRVHVDTARRWEMPRGLNTRNLRNGTHRLMVRATFGSGAVRTHGKTVTVRNAIASTTESDRTAPRAPSGLTATPSSGQIALDWGANPEPDLSYYAVRRSTSATGPWERLPGNHTSSSYVDRSVVSGRRYYYFVTAIDTSKNVSDRSPTVDATVPGSVPAGNPLWAAGFEGSVLSSWIGAQWDPDLALAERIRTDSTTARTGGQSARFSVRPGDSLSGTARAQVFGARKTDGSELRFREGDDYYMGFSMKLAADYPMDPGKWQQLVSFMRDGSGQGPLKMGTSFERDRFRIEGPDGDKVYWRGPIEKGAWLDFVVRVRFSANPSNGFLEVWYKRPQDGELVRQTMTNGQQRLYTNTMAAGSNYSYLKAGLYRDPRFTADSIAWYDSFKIGRQFEDVAPR